MNRPLNWKNIAAAIFFVALITFAVFEHSRSQQLRRRVEALEKHGAWFEKETRTQIAILATQPVSNSAVSQETVEHIEKLINAQAEASSQREVLLKRLQQTQQRQQQIGAELNKVRAATSTASEQINAVSSEVGNVKTELAT